MKPYTNMLLCRTALLTSPILTLKHLWKLQRMSQVLYGPKSAVLSSVMFTKFRWMQGINPSFHFCCIYNPAKEKFSHVKKCFINFFLCTSSIFHRRSRQLLVALTFPPVSVVCRKINTWTHECRHFVSTLVLMQKFTQIMLCKHTLAYRKEAYVPCCVHVSHVIN
jgi:hypothetical protein